jgi:hypothetical protein
MLLIAHRGNITGPNPLRENSPDYINEALQNGYDVEVDVWMLDDQIYLGHNLPKYDISIDYLKNDKLWCHCKNIDALKYLLDSGVHCFFHKSDDVTLTSRGVIWTFPNKQLVEGSVCVMPEYGYKGNLYKCMGICSDYIKDFKK